MKNKMVIIAAFLSMGILFSGCRSSETKIEDAKEDLNEAQQDLNEAVRDSIQDFNNESATRLNDYEKEIAELRTKIASGSEETRAALKNELDKLEQKRLDLKGRIQEFRGDNKASWKEFKREMDHDMDELGKALKNLTVDNSK